MAEEKINVTALEQAGNIGPDDTLLIIQPDSGGTQKARRIQAARFKGEDAYDVAVRKGYTGTYEEWQQLVGNVVKAGGKAKKSKETWVVGRGISLKSTSPDTWYAYAVNKGGQSFVSFRNNEYDDLQGIHLRMVIRRKPHADVVIDEDYSAAYWFKDYTGQEGRRAFSLFVPLPDLNEIDLHVCVILLRVAGVSYDADRILHVELEGKVAPHTFTGSNGKMGFVNGRKKCILPPLTLPEVFDDSANLNEPMTGHLHVKYSGQVRCRLKKRAGWGKRSKKIPKEELGQAVARYKTVTCGNIGGGIVNKTPDGTEYIGRSKTYSAHGRFMVVPYLRQCRRLKLPPVFLFVTRKGHEPLPDKGQISYRVIIRDT